MQLSLRPYVTTGVALVGASVLVAAPISRRTPPDVQDRHAGREASHSLKSPAEVELASVITDLLGAFDELSVAVGQGIGGGYQLPPPAPAPRDQRTRGMDRHPPNSHFGQHCKRRLRTRRTSRV